MQNMISEMIIELHELISCNNCIILVYEGGNKVPIHYLRCRSCGKTTLIQIIWHMRWDALLNLYTICSSVISGSEISY